MNVRDEAIYLKTEAAARGYNLPALLDECPDIFTLDGSAVVDCPCPNCESTIVSTRDALGDERNGVDMRETGSSLRLVYIDPPQATPNTGHVGDQVTHASYALECMAGGRCTFRYSSRAVLDLVFASLDSERFVAAARRVFPVQYRPILRQWYCVTQATGDDDKDGDVYLSFGSPDAALRGLNPAAGSKVFVALVQAATEQSARLLLTPEAWTSYTTDADQALPLGFEDGEPKTYEAARRFAAEAKEDARRRAEVEAEIQAATKAIRAEQ